LWYRICFIAYACAEIRLNDFIYTEYTLRFVIQIRTTMLTLISFE